MAALWPSHSTRLSQGEDRAIPRKSLISVFLLLAVCLAGGGKVHGEQQQALIGGWDVFPPYSYTENNSGITRWTGLDVELLHEISQRAGYFISADFVAWPELVAGLEAGEIDIVAQATLTSQRTEFANFSIPYRTETTVLVVPKGRSQSIRADRMDKLIQRLTETGFRLGVAHGAAYPSSELRAFIDDPANQDRVFKLNVAQLVGDLMDGKIDGFLADRILAAYFIEALGAQDRLEEHPLMIHGDLRLMFSKSTVPVEVVERFNEAIQSVHDDGTYRRLNANYAFPILVRLTLDSGWFRAVDIIGTAAFAISGLLLAFRYHYDVFGALVLASLPAVGGGVVRDLITNREELAVLASPIYIVIIVVLVVGGYFVVRAAVLIRNSAFGAMAVENMDRTRAHIAYTIQLCDAIGLAAFTVTGVVVALVTHANPLWIWGPILAAITASGGGILRDVVRSDPEVPALKGELYPEIAVLWGFLLSIYFMWDARHLNAGDIQIGIIVTFLGALLTRMITIHLGWKSPRFSA